MDTLPTSEPYPRYTRVAAWLHWLIAVFILLNLTLGWFMERFAPPVKMVVLPLHISAGISVLALTLLRVLWRLTHRPPEHVPALTAAEDHASHLVHFLLYAGMVAMPLTGWALLSAHPKPGSPGAVAAQAAMPAPPPSASPLPAGARQRPMGGIHVWWVLPLPSITPVQEIGQEPGGLPAQKRLHDELVHWHSLGAWLMIGLLLLHVAGALKHQFVDRTPIIRRMRLTH